MISIDLHMHSYYSDDGEFSPIELVHRCSKAGIRIMAVSDHNSARANEEASQEAALHGIHYIPAIEMDCVYKGLNLHILGYGINYRSPDFQKVEENVTAQEATASQERLRLTRQLGFDIDESELHALSSARPYCKDAWTGEMFAEVLLAREEYHDSEILKPYRPDGPRGDNPLLNFSWDHYAQGKPCHTKIYYPSFEECLAIIHSNGGKAVLAHPGNNLRGRWEILDQIVPFGLDGIEAFSNYHQRSESEYFYQKGRALNLMIVCGSDFHGKTKPTVRLGECGCFADEHEIEAGLIQAGLLS